MGLKEKCKECKRNYKRLAKGELCAFCYQKLNGKWAKEFSEMPKAK